MVNYKQSSEQTNIGRDAHLPTVGWIPTSGPRRLPTLSGSLVICLWVLPACVLLRAADSPGPQPDPTAAHLQANSPHQYFNVSGPTARPSSWLLPEGRASLGWPTAACGPTCGATRTTARSPLGFAHRRLMANSGAPGSSAEPPTAAAADPNPPPQQVRGMMTAAGSNQQVQANNAGSLAGIPGSSVNFTTGSLTLAPSSGQDATPLALIPSVPSPTADIFQVYQAGATRTNTCATNLGCAFAVQSNGNLYFAGNNATYGAPSQATQSYFRLYGSASGSSNLAPPYLQFLSGTGSSQTNLFSSISQSGILCAGASAPGGDCAAGQQITLNPMTTAGDLIYGGSTVLGTAQPKRLAIGSVGQCLQVLTSSTLGYGSCGSGGGTVSSVGLSMPAGFIVNSSPVTNSGTLSVTGPLTSEGDLPYYHSNVWSRLGVGTSGQCLTSNGTDPLWSACGSGSVTSVGLSLPPQFSVSQSPVTSSGMLAGAWTTLGASVTADPNFPAMPVLLQRRTTMLLASGGGSFSGVGDVISGTGTVVAVVPSASFPDARITISTGTTAHTAVGFSGNGIYRTGLNSNGSAGIFFNARADMNGATANYHAFLGLTDQSVAATMAGTSNDCKFRGIYAAVSACTDGAYTSSPPNASTHWVCVTNNADGNATGQNSIDSGVAFDGNEHRFAIWEDVANAKWHFYIDGAEVCGNGIAANYPSATNLKLEYGATNTTTTAVALGAAGFQAFSN